MPRSPRLPALVLLVFLAAGSVVAQEQPRSSATAFLLSTFVGFGSGRYYCGANGIGFLVADSISVVMVGYGLLSGSSASSFNGALQGAAFIELGAVVFLISRIAQIVDIFGVIDEGKKAGRLTDIIPVIDVDVQRAALEMGISFEY